MHGVHQTPADRAILHGWVDRDRPDTSDAVAFIEKIADFRAATLTHQLPPRVPENPARNRAPPKSS